MSESEDRARLSGWTPAEEFKGDPDRWVDAETWNKRADELMPILKATNKKLEEKLTQYESEIGATKKELEDLRKTTKRMADVGSKISQREYDRALETIRKEQSRAVAEGDADAFERLEKQKDSLEKPEPIEINTPDPRNDFISRNPWYGQDGKEEMTGYAYIMAEKYAKQGLAPEEQLTRVEADVKQKFPEEFGNKRRQTAAVDGDDKPPQKPSKKGYSSLPAEAKAMCDKLCASIEGYTKEQYVKDYFEGEE